MMPTVLNLIPAQVAIGTFTDSAGNSVDVFMTPEFMRALSDVSIRIGGQIGLSSDEIGTMAGGQTDDHAEVAALRRRVADLTAQLESAAHPGARMAALERKLDDLARLVQSSGPAPVDWEHPGKIGAGTANSAKFTAATVQTLNKLSFTQPATAATYTLADGKTFTVTNSIALAGVDGKTLTLSNTLGFSGTDGAFLNIGAGGTLGSAAYASSGSFAARSSTALAPVATDAASTQTLANSIRAILVSVGIGT